MPSAQPRWSSSALPASMSFGPSAGPGPPKIATRLPISWRGERAGRYRGRRLGLSMVVRAACRECGAPALRRLPLCSASVGHADLPAAPILYRRVACRPRFGGWIDVITRRFVSPLRPPLARAPARAVDGVSEPSGRSCLTPLSRHFPRQLRLEPAGSQRREVGSEDLENHAIVCTVRFTTGPTRRTSSAFSAMHRAADPWLKL